MTSTTTKPINVTMSRTRHGDEEAHRTGCADLHRGHHRHASPAEKPCIGEYTTREAVAAEWFVDIIAENLGSTGADYVDSIHFAPCLDGLA